MGRPYVDTVELEKRAAVIWDTNPNLRSEFSGRRDHFEAWLRAAGRGQVHQTTGRAVTKHTRPEGKDGV